MISFAREMVRRHRFRSVLARARQSIEQQAGGPDEVDERIGATLEQVRSMRFSPEQQAWFDRIETRRSTLLADRATIRFVDYGAGHAAAQREPHADTGPSVSERSIAQLAQASKAQSWATLLHGLTRNLELSRCLEMGTCVGISASYIGAALCMAGTGRLITIEGSEQVARVATDTFAALGLADEITQRVGPFSETLRPALAELGEVDFVFVDGHHDGDATIAYYEALLPHLAPRSLAVFDDIAWSAGMAHAWAAIRTHERTAWAVDLGVLGLVRPRPRVSSSTVGS